MNRVMIAGSASGCGKTTIVCGILQILKNRKVTAASFKCGPDYIDPMFHRSILDTPSYNLDGFFMDKNRLQYCLMKNSKNVNVTVIEGAMGYYDGVGMRREASACQIAEDTNTPVVIVLPCKGMSRSVLAMLNGFLSYEGGNQIKGVIFNQLAPSLYEEVKEYCEVHGVKALGYLPYEKGITLESRHLGLVTAEEITDLKEKMNQIAIHIEKYIDVDGILKIASRAESAALDEGYEETEREICKLQNPAFAGLRIGVARDKAFCFYYEDNLSMLKELGCELVYFSPLEDQIVPQGMHGLILGGGYPELYAKKLSQNESMRTSVREAVLSKMPTHAECGGFLYLHKTLIDPDENEFEMASVLEETCYFTQKLQHFGYVTLTAMQDNLLSEKGDVIRAHEFHRCVSQSIQNTFDTEKRQMHWGSFVAQDNLLAGFPHIHYLANPAVLVNFVKKCEAYRKAQNR